MPTKPQITCDQWLAALGEPSRLALVRQLAAGPKTVTQLAKGVRTKAMNTSYHLRALKNAALVSEERDGQYRLYSLVGATVAAGVLEMSHASGARICIPVG